MKTKQFNIIHSSILSITPDQHLQILIVDFYFDTFLKKTTNFNTPITITTTLLIDLNFKPLYTTKLYLIINTTPITFNTINIPILITKQITNIDNFKINQIIKRQLPFITIIVLF